MTSIKITIDNIGTIFQLPCTLRIEKRINEFDEYSKYQVYYWNEDNECEGFPPKHVIGHYKEVSKDPSDITVTIKPGVGQFEDLEYGSIGDYIILDNTGEYHIYKK